MRVVVDFHWMEIKAGAHCAPCAGSKKGEAVVFYGRQEKRGLSLT
jgi:hypothetical protein